MSHLYYLIPINIVILYYGFRQLSNKNLHVVTKVCLIICAIILYYATFRIITNNL